MGIKKSYRSRGESMPSVANQQLEALSKRLDHYKIHEFFEQLEQAEKKEAKV
jgi:hypothetical protein